jgi:hypothetical protein
MNVLPEEVRTMKKLILSMTALGLVLAFGVAYADDNATRENGISIFALGPVSWDSGPVASGSEIVALKEEGAEMKAENGITLFTTGPIAFDSGAVEYGGTPVLAEGSAAGGLREDGAGLKAENGITIFMEGPVSYDSGER